MIHSKLKLKEITQWWINHHFIEIDTSFARRLSSQQEEKKISIKIDTSDLVLWWFDWIPQFEKNQSDEKRKFINWKTQFNRNNFHSKQSNWKESIVFNWFYSFSNCCFHHFYHFETKIWWNSMNWLFLNNFGQKEKFLSFQLFFWSEEKKENEKYFCVFQIVIIGYKTFFIWPKIEGSDLLILEGFIFSVPWFKMLFKNEYVLPRVNDE